MCPDGCNHSYESRISKSHGIDSRITYLYNDQYEYIMVEFKSAFGENVSDLMIAYVGCIVCHLPEFSDYKKSMLASNNSVCDGVQCRYCGLTRHHHANNRELPHIQWGRLNIDPMWIRNHYEKSGDVLYTNV